MTSSVFPIKHLRINRAGFSMVETTVCTLLVGLLLVAATQSAGSSLRTQIEAAHSVKASALADSLMSEILACSYMEPGATSSVLGRDINEYSNWKVDYDDVDDFNAWSEKPPQYRNGYIMPNMASWRRSVTVQWINIANDGTISVASSETNHKRITVTVSFDNVVVTTRQALVINP
jgi:type II secretory pathway pseudopilin PulG